MKKSFFNQAPPLAKVFTPTAIFICAILLILDLGSKKWMTNHLNFFLNQEQLQYLDVTHPNTNVAGAPTADNKKNTIALIGTEGKWVKFRLVFNDRFIFGLGPNTPILGFLLTAIATAGLFFFRWLVYSQGNLFAWSLIFAGAFGNLIDKMFIKSLTTREWVLSLIPQKGFTQGVTDFIECIWFGVEHWQNTFFLQIFSMPTWPTFNLADSYIVVAVFILLITFQSHSSSD